MTFPTRLQAKLTSHTGPVHCLTFSFVTGQYLLTGSSDRTIHLSNPSKPPAHSLIQSYSAHGHEILDIALTQDNARFASVGGDKQVFLWDVSSARTLRRWEGHFGRVNAVEFAGEDSHSGQPSLMVSGSFDATVRVWDVRSHSAKPVQVLEEARDAVQAVRVAGAEILAASVDGWVRCYDVRMGHVVGDLVAPGKGVTSLDLTKDGQAYLVSALDHRIRLMDRGDGKCLMEYKGHKNGEYRVRSCLGMGDAVVLSGSEDGYIYAWDVLSGEVLAKVEAHGGKVASSVAWNGPRKQWASAGVDGTVCVWGMPTE